MFIRVESDPVWCLRAPKLRCWCQGPASLYLGQFFVQEMRLDFICVSCLGFLLRTREHLISSTLLIPLGFVWSASSSCYISGASLGILGVPHLLIVVRCDCGWKNLSRDWIASAL